VSVYFVLWLAVKECSYFTRHLSCLYSDAQMYEGMSTFSNSSVTATITDGNSTTFPEDHMHDYLS